ncbi:MAG: hypothetical protein Q9227_004927 [Pyrenula ochraceoflavens]
MPPRTGLPIPQRKTHAFICGRCRRKQLHESLGGRIQTRRWITQNHIRNIRAAEEDWETRAKDIRGGKKKSMLKILEERGLINQIVGSRENLDLVMTERRTGAYAGVDPTAPSLHIGHMVPFMALAWMYIHGYGATFLIGGSTAVIGDPTGRKSPREALRSIERKANIANIHMQLKRLGVHIESTAKRYGYHPEWAWKRALENNNIWWGKVSFYEVIRTMGPVVRLGPLLGRDTVKNRMETNEGMSFGEFCYPLMQAWDWWHLYQKGCQLQIGGADQFGNILAGADAVSRIAKVKEFGIATDARLGHEAAGSNERMAQRVASLRKTKPKIIPDDPMGFTTPLLTNSANEKFGKSLGNAIWLDQDMTSSFDLYQFFLKTADADVERYLKMFTFMPLTEIEQTMVKQHADPSTRVAQHKLAFEFVFLAHGTLSARQAEEQHRQAFKKDITVQGLMEGAVTPSGTAHSGKSNDKEVPPGGWNPSVNKYALPTTANTAQPTRTTLPRSLVIGQPFNRVLWSAGLVASKSEGARLIQSKGAHVGSKYGQDREMGDNLSFTAITTTGAEATVNYLIDDALLILRIGKWKMRIISVVSDEEFEEKGLSCPGWAQEPKKSLAELREEVQTIQEFNRRKNQKRLERQAQRGVRKYEI